MIIVNEQFPYQILLIKKANQNNNSHKNNWNEIFNRVQSFWWKFVLEPEQFKWNSLQYFKDFCSQIYTGEMDLKIFLTQQNISMLNTKFLCDQQLSEKFSTWTSVVSPLVKTNLKSEFYNSRPIQFGKIVLSNFNYLKYTISTIIWPNL